MSENHCEHIHPDGARCQAHPQTGKSYCFFHDPEQQENRAAARRNGGFMREEAIRTALRTDAAPLLPADSPYLPARTRDDIAQRLEEIFNWLEQNVRDRQKAKALQIYTLNTLSNNLAAEERKEREAARAAERAAQRAAREACTKEAIERAVQQALSKAGIKNIPCWVPRREPQASASSSASDGTTGTVRLVSGHDPAERDRAASASTDVGFSQPRPAAGPCKPVGAPTEQSRNRGTAENSPPFQRWETDLTENQLHSAPLSGATRAAERSATDKTAETETAKDRAATGQNPLEMELLRRSGNRAQPFARNRPRWVVHPALQAMREGRMPHP